MRHALLLAACLLAGCAGGTTLDYQDDVGYMPSAVGGSPEYVVGVNGYACVDVEGKGGLCSARQRRDHNLTITVQPKPYAYRLHVVCTDTLHVDQSFDAEAGHAQEVTIDHALYGDLKAFVCIGEVFPGDRKEKVSATFEVRVKLTVPGYNAREQIHPFRRGEKTYLSLGSFARTSYVWDHGKWTAYQKQVEVPVSDAEDVRAYSESYDCRFNYFGF